MNKEESLAIINEAKKSDVAFKGIVESLKKVIDKSLDLDSVLIAKYELANLYKRSGRTFKVKENTEKTEGEVAKKRGELAKETGEVDVSALKDAYIRSRADDKMWQLLEKVQLISKRVIVYDKTEAIRGLKVPEVDMSNVDSLEAFMSRLIGAIPEGSYTVEVSDTKIIIKKHETA